MLIPKLKNILGISWIAIVITSTVGCSGSSTSGIFNQVFNISGQWIGTMSDSSGNQRATELTLTDSGGTINGTLLVTGHSCIDGGTVTGTSTQAIINTAGDNPLTADQENSDSGIVSLALTSGQATGGVSAVTVGTAGSGYSSTPTVSFSSPPTGGTTASGTAILGTGDDSETITGVVITNSGSGYVTAPTITFSGGGGSGAIATSTIDTSTVTDSVTISLTGSSSSLSGTYSGVWKSSTGSCSIQTSGSIILNET
tara:strand:+ start:149 stop:916 length:768 start_codon:yes stop_codon:yes gene_type:complete